ncbi:MAG: nuclear transport factor 2 family protein [Candidatus Methanomethylicaceae archaeon]|jgi:ketosteroid isomerase-like protein
MSAKDFEVLVRAYHRALAEFFKGNYKPIEEIFSHTSDVTLANPFGGISHGWESVAGTVERTAGRYKNGTIKIENVEMLVSTELALLVDFERVNVQVDGREDMTTMSHRVTSIFREEDGIWRLAHRHADPLVALQKTGSATQK